MLRPLTFVLVPAMLSAVLTASFIAPVVLPGALETPSRSSLRDTLGGACIYPSFNCNTPDGCGNDYISGKSTYYDYWGGHSGISDSNTGLFCVFRIFYSQLNCTGLFVSDWLYACS